MDRSQLSNIIATTRLVHHFSQPNLDVLKSCIFKQLGCHNEANFLCKSLLSLSKTMTLEATATIKNKAMELADLQSIQQSLDHDNKITNNNASNHKSNHITLHKHIQQQHNDPLSQLDSDTIDHLGTFLLKKESVEFGYLNKQLFIETQKHSYLLKRCKDTNDEPLHMDNNRVRKLVLEKCIPFNYYFPKNLEMNLFHDEWTSFWDINLSSNSLKEKIFGFENFFGKLQSINCKTCRSLCCVPWDVVFATRQDIENIFINVEIIPGSFNHVKKFCDVFSNCKQIKTSNINIKIKQLNIRLTGTRRRYQTMRKQVCKKLLLTCGTHSKSIRIMNGWIVVDAIQELKRIFHNNLKSFSFADLRLDVNISSGNNDNDKDDDDSKEKNEIGGMEIEIGNIQMLGMKVQHDFNDDWEKSFSAINALKCLDRFKMRRLIKHYTLEWKPLSHYFFRSDTKTDSSFDIFDKILFQDYDKHPLLEKITIKFNINRDLSGFARLLLYFNDKYKQIFEGMKLYLKKFQYIEIEFNGLDVKLEQFHNYSQFENPQMDIFRYIANETYPVQEKIVNMSNIQPGVKTFGIIYANVFQWLQHKQKKDMKQNCQVRWLV